MKSFMLFLRVHIHDDYENIINENIFLPYLLN